jgi:hypothetical protein
MWNSVGTRYSKEFMFSLKKCVSNELDHAYPNLEMKKILFFI